MPRSLSALLVAGCLALPFGAAACSLVPSAAEGALAPTLAFQDEVGGRVAFESGQPVPTFDRQPRMNVDLNGPWHFDSQDFDTSLTLSDRKSALPAIVAAAGDRLGVGFDDSQWPSTAVPGSFDQPPTRSTTGGYYRRDFYLAPEWTGKYALLKFGAIRYVADVWLNGHYLGYHEGGDTPFALDATQAIVPGAYNALVIRVDNPEWGTRTDIIPWGLADWWNYGGIIGNVWMEAVPAMSVVRADVTPHLDGGDVSIVVQHRGADTVATALDVRLWPAQINASNLMNPDASSLIPPDAVPLLYRHIDLGNVSGESVFKVAAPFSIRLADLWSPSLPALYVLDVTVLGEGKPTDQLFTSFGLRQIKVDSTAPRLLFNGNPIVFNGVAMHEERQQPPQDGNPAGGPLTSPDEIVSLLRRALGVHADLVRVDHHPPNQMLPVLADRLGLALWEEIPLYHYTPQTFTIAMQRGVAQQMLAEMDLRDFNRPSVLFHGFANESSGDAERTSALNTLAALDRRIDGSRLTGQAMYGIDPTDPTSAGLDVAAYTMYYGVLYGGPLSGATLQSALMQAHHTYPRKPIMILEYGHWADDPGEEPLQVRVFDTYYAQLAADFDTEPQGFIGAGVWWTLDDYWSERPGISLERFGLYRPDGTLRPVGVAVSRVYALTAPSKPPTTVRSAGVAVPITAGARSGRLLPYLAYGFLLPALILIVVIAGLSRVRRRAW